MQRDLLRSGQPGMKLAISHVGGSTFLRRRISRNADRETNSETLGSRFSGVNKRHCPQNVIMIVAASALPKHDVACVRRAIVEQHRGCQHRSRSMISRRNLAHPSQRKKAAVRPSDRHVNHPATVSEDADKVDQIKHASPANSGCPSIRIKRKNAVSAAARLARASPCRADH